MSEQNKECSVLIVSCDKYTDVAFQNVKLLDKFWSDCPFEKFCITESVCVEGTTPINYNSPLWSKRLLFALNSLKTPFVFLVLDDLWPEEFIDSDNIIQYLNEMKKNKKISNIAFSDMPGKTKKKTILHCSLRNKKPWSIINFQVGLWNVETLKLMLKESENPWDAEVLGSLRTRLFPEFEFYCLDDDANSPYVYGKGWLVVRGKWNAPEVLRLEKKLEIKIALGSREIGDFSNGINLSLLQRVDIHLRVFLYKIKIAFLKIYRRI